MFGVQHQVLPQPVQAIQRRGELRLQLRGHRCERLHRRRAAFGLAVSRGELRVGADAVLPIRPEVAAHGLELVPELALDGLEVVAEGRQLQPGPGVFRVPILNEFAIAGNQIGIFELAAEHQQLVRYRARLLVGLKQLRQPLAAARLLRGQSADEPQLRILARVGHQHFLTIRPLPPEGRMRLPASVQRLRAAIVVGAGRQVFYARRVQRRGIGPRVRGHVGDVGIVGILARGAIQGLARVERPYHGLQVRASQHQVGVLRGDGDAPGAYPIEEFLLRGRGARAQKLLHRPHAVDREAQRRIRTHLLQQPVEVAVLQLLDFRLVVGKADVQMVVRHDEYGEFAAGCEPHHALHRAPPESQFHLRRRVRGKFRDREFEALLAEPAGRGRCAIFRAGDGERERRGPGDSRQRNGDVNQLTQFTVFLNIEIRWRDFDARDRLGQTRVAQQFERIPFDRRIAVLIRRVIHRRDLQLVLPGAQ